MGRRVQYRQPGQLLDNAELKNEKESAIRSIFKESFRLLGIILGYRK